MKDVKIFNPNLCTPLRKSTQNSFELFFKEYFYILPFASIIHTAQRGTSHQKGENIYK